MSEIEAKDFETFLEIAKKRCESERKELLEINYNSIVVSFIRFYAQQHFLKDDILCVDVLGCLNSTSKSDKSLAEVWLKVFPEKMLHFCEKLKNNKIDFNQHFRRNIDRYLQEMTRMLCDNCEPHGRPSLTSSSSSLLTSSSKAVQRAFDEKVKFIADNYRIVRHEEILADLYKTIFQRKLNALEEATRVILEKNLENATIFMKEKFTNIKCLEAKIRLLEMFIRSGSSSTSGGSTANKENDVPNKNGFTEERYKQIVIENEKLEKEYELLKKQNEVLSTLNKEKVSEYLQLHREHEYMSNLMNGNTSNISLSSLQSAQTNNSVHSRFSSTPLNSSSRLSLNFSSNPISFSFDEIPKELDEISFNTSLELEQAAK